MKWWMIFPFVVSVACAQFTPPGGVTPASDAKYFPKTGGEISGDTTVDGTLEVSDTATFSDTSTFNGTQFQDLSANGSFFLCRNSSNKIVTKLYNFEGKGAALSLYDHLYVEKVRFDSRAGEINYIANGGNVGIGTSTPSNKLEVAGTLQAANTTINGTLNVSGSATFAGLLDVKEGATTLRSSTSDGYSRLYIDQQVPRAKSTVGLVGTDLADGTSTLHIGGGTSLAYGPTKVQIYTAYTNTSLGTVKMTIDNTGNVGIGTSTPSNKLEVAGTLQATDTTINGTLGVSGKSTFTEKQTIKTANSTSGLNVRNGDDHSIFNISSDGDGDGVLGVYDKAGTIKTLIYSTGYSYFNGGNVGIGTTTPSAKLEVAGTIKASSINFSGLQTTTNGLTSGDVWNDGGTLKIMP